MLLPWEYGVRNLSRRPLRTLLTLLGLSTVVLLILAVVGFIRGLERSLAVSGDERVMLVYSVNSSENIENSSIGANSAQLLQASLTGIDQSFGVPNVSPELFLGTNVAVDGRPAGFGLIRGVTDRAPLVRTAIRITEGTWPRQGEILVGRLAAAKIGVEQSAAALGAELEFEGRSWTVSGHFSAAGSAFESEIWCPLNDFQTATKRQDLTLTALRLRPDGSPAEVDLFCKQRTDLELQSTTEAEYFASLQQHYRGVRILGWLIVILVAAAGTFTGLNLMYASVAGRGTEIAMLQAIGFRRGAILLSVIQESVLLCATASLLSGAIALFLFQGMAVRFTMGAFTLRIDSAAILISSLVGLSLGVLGALPPAIKVLSREVTQGLRAT